MFITGFWAFFKDKEYVLAVTFLLAAAGPEAEVLWSGLVVTSKKNKRTVQ